METSNNKNNIKKLFIFDFGGTLVTANVLNEICGINGNKEKSIEINKNAKKTELHDVNALCERINLMNGIKISEIVDLLDCGHYLRAGVKDLFIWLKNHGFITMVITANILPVLEYYKDILGIDYIFGSKPTIENGVIKGIDIKNSPSPDFKYEWCLDMINKLEVEKNNIYAIGDTMRDKRMLSLAGNKFVVNPKGGIEAYADYVVQNNFHELIDYILQH